MTGLASLATLVSAAITPITVAAATIPHNPWGALTTVVQQGRGVTVSGWALDVAGPGAVRVEILVDGRKYATTTASLPRTDLATTFAKYNTYTDVGVKHGFERYIYKASGTYQICARVYSLAPATLSKLTCRTVTIRNSPFGALNSVTGVPGGVQLKGWAVDYDAPTTPLSVQVKVDGKLATTITAKASRPDVAAKYGAYAERHGFTTVVSMPYGKHSICLIAKNRSLGSDLVYACRTVTAGDRVPDVPAAASAKVSGTQVTVSWSPPAANGGTPVTGYTLTSSPAGFSKTVTATTKSVSFTGLTPQKPYTWAVAAHNAAGKGDTTPTNTVVGPPPPIAPVTSPALVSTSRYIRNIHGVAKDTTTTFAMGATDASYNPSHHRYLMLLDIGGQTTTKIGLSATSIYITYAQLVTALKAYIDGYASTQKYNAPAIIAIGVNNDIDVRALTGQIWADQVIDPLVAYARKYPNIEIAGANDMEPGFIGTVAQTKAWLTGYLGATTARFVFNGSADGCNSTKANGSCNNGWKAADLQWLAGGAAPTRILALPQIYNTTMAKQWKFISLTGVLGGKAKINFAGPLTEWTACYTQHGGCGSLTNNQAWTALWNELNSDARVQQSELTYGTDLRIN